VELYELAVEQRDWNGALEVHHRLFPVAEYLLTNQIPAVAKAGMEIRGRRGGPPRPPLTRLSTEELQKLRSAIARLETPVPA